ncbi:MerR family transcriptional regulator [Billgrantia tianxiuensis]|jgi:DNA-binding transcriptional MerR regulator|uniref:MerR family transcriptional regulator n=1 Tax=Billgrantia tianxiuensis TaxID=2497861 RepID=A0A6I6SRW0_9GAMM|nr:MULTISPECIES: MerR family transcriptional regulator [Halomonas]MCE8033944.1 MerR family transcriptional regulator [Halomonas sp. MCCC 1A11057]QHC51486.1 MerR family transcriptional regulator [Halomonas tianxiuensis]
MTEKATHPADTPLYPIREVSRITGVNSVTLRAWERRYGLIRPQRTPKGHRLYAREDIERVERILQWLGRGVPVSQVKELIDQPQAAPVAEPISGDWSSQRRLLTAAIEALDQGQMETLFTQSLALYPVATCLAELWQPVVRELEEHWADQLGAALQRRYLESFLRTRIGIRLYHANQQARGPALLIAPLPDDPGALWLLLAALAASDAGYRVSLLDGALPLGELPLAVERLQAAALVLVSGRAERADLIRRQLPRLAEQLDAPLGLCGPVARIRSGDLADSLVELLGDDLPLAMTRMRSLIFEH